MEAGTCTILHPEKSNYTVMTGYRICWILRVMTGYRICWILRVVSLVIAYDLFLKWHGDIGDFSECLFCEIKVTLSLTRGYGDRATVLATDVRLANYSTSGYTGVSDSFAYETPQSLVDVKSISTSKKWENLKSLRRLFQTSRGKT